MNNNRHLKRELYSRTAVGGLPVAVPSRHRQYALVHAAERGHVRAVREGPRGGSSGEDTMTMHRTGRAAPAAKPATLLATAPAERGSSPRRRRNLRHLTLTVSR
jgi:hypothetical protein